MLTKVSRYKTKLYRIVGCYRALDLLNFKRLDGVIIMVLIQYQYLA